MRQFLLEICTGTGMAGIPRNPQEWVQLLQEYCGDGIYCRVKSAGCSENVQPQPRNNMHERQVLNILTNIVI